MEVTRGHPLRYVTHTCKTDIYRGSYFPKTTIDWNNLPTNIVSAPTLNSFNTGLAQPMGLPNPQI